VAQIETKTTLSAHPSSVGSARRFVRDVLMSRQVGDPVVETVTLLTSEVVTNALVHAGSGPELVVRLQRGAVRVEVHDEGPAVPVRRVIDLEAASGRDMAIVDELAHTWGVEHIPTGKRVWFEVST
jgi:anti-sigma regulatory factor (Ser/Thr protein kinase)